MVDYYKKRDDFKGIPLEVEHIKRDYYKPTKKEETNEKPLVKRDRQTSKDYETMAKGGGEKFMRDYTLYPLFKRRAIILAIKDKKVLENLLNYEKNEKLRTMIQDKLNK